MGNANEWADCSGQISTKFEWHSEGPGDDPPKQVIIRESCSVSWFGYGVSSPAFGVADNGLGFPEVPNGPVPIYDGSGNLEYWEGGGDASGTRYTIEPGKQTVKVTCSPRASTDGGSGGHAEVSLFYTVDVEPLEVNLAGGIGLGNAKRYLIGQQVTATLSSGGLTPRSYNWSASGGEPFKTWTATRNSTTPSAAQPSLGSETGSQFDFHFKKPADGKATVSCSVHLAVPVGAMPARGFDVTPDRQCSVERPDAASFSAYTPQNASQYPGPGSILQPGYTANGVGLYYAPIPLTMAFLGLSAPGYDSVGIRWDGYVTTSTASPNPWGGDGGWNYVQIIQVNRHRINQGMYQTNAENGPEQLDTTYPYEPVSLGTYPADGSTGTAGDGPGTGLDSAYTEVEVSEPFDTWMMYQPPGTGSVFVPLKKIKWNWYGKAQKSSGRAWLTTDLVASDSGWQFDGDYPLFPLWTDYVDTATLQIWNPPVP